MEPNHYAPPSTPHQDDGPPRKKVWARRVLFIAVAALFLPVVLFVAWDTWRARTLLAFCKAAQPGIAFPELLALEKRYWIDDSYVVQARFEDYIDRAHSPSLTFRSSMLDPDFECEITHDGKTVKFVELHPEGFDSD